LVNQIITVLKLDTNNQETWRYQGKILDYEDHKIVIEAFFNRNDVEFHGIQLNRNDRFLEYFFNNRWYNIFQIHDREDDHLKGWYCNVCQPAIFSDSNISYIDLALDLLVFPDGKQLVLDEDEFEVLDLPNHTSKMAINGLNQLKRHFNLIDFNNLPEKII
jgi:protein associated with RNAse G/E